MVETSIHHRVLRDAVCFGETRLENPSQQGGGGYYLEVSMYDVGKSVHETKHKRHLGRCMYDRKNPQNSPRKRSVLHLGGTR